MNPINNLQQFDSLKITADLSSFMERKRCEWVRNANVHKISFYRELGEYFNGNYPLNGPQHQVRTEIAGILMELYGNLFTEKQLLAMFEFFCVIPDAEEAGLLANMVSWEHILELLPVEKQEARLFYAWLSATRNYTTEELGKYIRENLYERAVVIKGKRLNELLGLSSILLKEVNSHEINEAIHKHLRSNITTQIDNPLQHNDYLEFLARTDKTPGDAGMTDISPLLNKINEFKQLQHQHVNFSLNYFFWETGTKLRRHLSAKSNIQYTPILQTVSSNLISKYGTNFEVGNLEAMLSFAEQYTDAALAAELAYSVCWAQLLILLPLNEPEVQFFYARLCASSCLKPTELIAKVKEGIFEHAAGTEKKFPVIDRKTEQHGDVTLTTFSLSLDGVRYDSACMNIFNSPCFLNIYWN